MSPQKKKIMLITSRSDMGGGPKHLSQLLKLIPENYEVTVAAPDGHTFSEDFIKTAYHFIPIPHRRFSVVTFFKLLFFLKNEEISLIHSHGRGAGYYSRLLGLFGPKVVHTFHGIHAGTGLIDRIKLFLDQLMAPLTTDFICVSPSENKKAHALKLITSQNYHIIPNGIELSSLNQIPARNLRDEFQLPATKKIWGYLARLSPEKGIDLFLKTVMKSSFNDFEFFIAGDGEKHRDYQNMIQESKLYNVHLIGETDQPISFLKGLDGYFSFSKGEGHPLSVLEAMACQLPCALSGVEGHHQFSPYARFFDLENPEEFEMALKSSDCPKDYRDFLKEYTLTQMAKRIILLYSAI